MIGVGPRSLRHLNRTQYTLRKPFSAKYTFEGKVANLSLGVIDGGGNFPVIAITYVGCQDPEVSYHPLGVGARSHSVTEAVL